MKIYQRRQCTVIYSYLVAVLSEMLPSECIQENISENPFQMFIAVYICFFLPYLLLLCQWPMLRG